MLGVELAGFSATGCAKPAQIGEAGELTMLAFINRRTKGAASYAPVQGFTSLLGEGRAAFRSRIDREADSRTKAAADGASYFASDVWQRFSSIPAPALAAGWKAASAAKLTEAQLCDMLAIDTAYLPAVRSAAAAYNLPALAGAGETVSTGGYAV